MLAIESCPCVVLFMWAAVNGWVDDGDGTIEERTVDDLQRTGIKINIGLLNIVIQRYKYLSIYDGHRHPP